MSKLLEKALIITNEKQRISMEEVLFKNLMSNTKEHIYWLDLNNRLIMCNQAQANFFNTSIDELIGKSTLEIGANFGLKKHGLKKVIKNNLSVVKDMKPKLISEVIEENNHKKIILSFKSPVINGNGEIMGIFGTSIDITQQYETQSYHQSLMTDIPTLMNLDRGITGNKKEKSFTFHESKCAAYLIQGKTAQQIAEILNEPRIRIEEHIQNLQAKSSCKNRSELLEIIIEHRLNRLLD